MRYLLWILAAGLALGACGKDEETHGVEEELCEHMAEGPAQAVTAGADNAGAPSATYEHTRVDISLTDVTGGKGGVVKYESGEATDYIFAMNKNIPVKIADAQGADVAVEATEVGSEACAEVAVQHTVALGVGTYYLSLGPTTETLVGLVVEEAAGHAHE